MIYGPVLLAFYGCSLLIVTVCVLCRVRSDEDGPLAPPAEHGFAKATSWIKMESVELPPEVRVRPI
jgi:hypothetical protein